MKFIADGKVPKFRKGVHSGHNSRMVIALAIREIKAARRERPNWGLALLMRPAEAAAVVPFANLPLCQRPNVCVSSHRGILARW
jgi:hypothetical protein